MFLYLAADYVRNPELRQRFAHNPQEVLREYLSSEQCAELEGYDRNNLKRRLHDEVDKLLRELELLIEIILVTDTRYWGTTNTPLVNKLSPAQAAVAETVSLTVFGTNFFSNVGVNFVAPDQTAVMIDPIVNFEQTQITGSVTFPTVGTYTCIVTNNPGTDDASSGSLAQAITVT